MLDGSPARLHIDLLRRVAEARDVAAFQALFEHFAPRVKAYLMRMSATDQMADDLAQETMLIVWRKAQLFDPTKASASTWIFTIARNVRVDAMRRGAHGRLDVDDPSLAADPVMSPDAELMIRENEEAVRCAVRALTPDQIKIVTMSFFSEKPHPQIAMELGIPLGTVKSRLRLALERLRAGMGRRS